MNDLKGIVAVPATPFTDDNMIDVDSMRRQTRAALDKGVVGFLVPAMAAEVYTLSDVERRQIVEIVREEVQGAVPIIGGATAEDEVSRRKNAEVLIGMGCDGILAYIPFDGEKSYRRQVRQLAELEPGFLMIQDLDQDSPGLPVHFIAELFLEIEAFTWIKVETSDRNPKFTAIREATGGRLKISSGGPGMIEGLDRGVSAWMPTLHHDIYVRAFNLYHEKRRSEAVALFYRLLPCLTFPIFQPPQVHLRHKLILKHEGIFKTTHIREKHTKPDCITIRQIEDLASYALMLSKSLDNIS